MILWTYVVWVTTKLFGPSLVTSVYDHLLFTGWADLTVVSVRHSPNLPPSPISTFKNIVFLFVNLLSKSKQYNLFSFSYFMKNLSLLIKTKSNEQNIYSFSDSYSKIWIGNQTVRPFVTTNTFKRIMLINWY